MIGNHHPCKCSPTGRSIGVIGIALSTAFAAAAGCSDPFQTSSGDAGGAGGEPAGEAGEGGRSPISGGAGGQAQDAGAPATDPLGGAGGMGGSESVTCDAGWADCNQKPGDGCEASLATEATCGACDVACQSAEAPYCLSAGGRYVCENPAKPLTLQRLELPCLSEDDVSGLCSSVADHATLCPAGGQVVRRMVTMGGEPGHVYDVSLRIRGVFEPKVYSGGTVADDHFYVGGAPTATNYNAFLLRVSAPEKTYALNADEGGGEAYYTFAVDHTKVIQVAGGATVVLEVTDADCAMVKNCKSFAGACEPHVIADIAPAPAGYNGQFVQIDVVGVADARD